MPDTIKLKPQIEIDTYIDQQATLKIITDYKPMYDQKLLDFKSLDEPEITFLKALDNFIHGVEGLRFSYTIQEVYEKLYNIEKKRQTYLTNYQGCNVEKLDIGIKDIFIKGYNDIEDVKLVNMQNQSMNQLNISVNVP